MSNAELWDLDTSGGIMEQIQLLVAPPVSADALRRSRRRRENAYRRPGRAVNHDSCDSCKEGGDLICCDRCPAAFHLLCHDPPLVEEELPTGEWLCHKCKITPQEAKDDDAESTSSKSSNRSIRGKRLAASIESDGKRGSANGDTDGDPEHPLKTLAKAARLMNPVQFDLGKEISCNKPLPGSSKRVYGKPVRHLPKKQAHELDNCLVPLPAKTCFTCSKSCRVAPLIQCDYCPLLFHLDCLNPPLTSVPTGRWMCPNHVEHFLDSCLLKSQSLTERLRLWDRYTGLVNSHTVKVDFLNKVHKKNPMFRYKRKLPPRSTISVPLAIKYFYKNPPSLLPDPVRYMPSTDATTELPGTRGPSVATLEEQEEWLQSVVSMQASIAKFLAQKQLQRTSDSGNKLLDSSTPTASKPTASVAPVVYKDAELSFSPALQSLHSDFAQKQTPVSGVSLANTSAEPFDCDISKQHNANCLLNGEQKSTSNGTYFQDEKFSSGPNWVLDTSARNSVSLLSNHVTNNVNNNSNNSVGIPTMNGIMDVLDITVPNSVEVPKPESLLRSRSNSVDSLSPSTGSYGNQWYGGDMVSSDRSNNNLDNCKNIVINALSNSAVVTRVLPGKPQPAKVILANNKASVLGTSVSSMGAPSQRGNVLPSLETSNNSVMTGSAHKVITVSATPSGRTVNASASNKNNNINSIIGSSSAIANLSTLLQQWIEGNSVDSEFSKIDEQLTYILAWQRLQQLMPSKSPPVTSTSPAAAPSNTTTSSLPYSSGKKGLLSVYLSQQSASEVRARAVLCPLSGNGQAVPMPYRCMTLGTGADMDVCLNNFGHCNFVSGHHATIFYDEMTRHFELLNYSEHGTTVDNVLYSCDFSDKPATTPKPSPLVAAVREVVNKGGKSQTGSSKSQSVPGDGQRAGVRTEKPRMSAHAFETYSPCGCKASSSSLISGNGAGWEGTALLHHGSYIKLGCLQFVFSIVDHAPDLPILAMPETLLPPPSSSSSSSLASTLTTTKFSSMPLLSSSQYLHGQPPVSLLKTHLKSSSPP
ncbi:hypothetical protein BsWGS_07705 [Bradybaena similaris]